MARPLLRASLRLRSLAVTNTLRAPLLRYQRCNSTSADGPVNAASPSSTASVQEHSPTKLPTRKPFSKPRRPSKPQAEARIPTFKVGSRSLIWTGNNGVSYEISHIRLRDSCKCHRCVDKHSKQRNFRLSDIPLNITPQSVKIHGQILFIRWAKDIPGFDKSHVSSYHINALQFPLEIVPSLQAGRQRSRILWGKKEMKQFQHWISYKDYMNNDMEFTAAMRSLALFGLIFVKDIPESREMVSQIATRMGVLRNTFYGPTWDVRKVPNAKNVAYTSQFLGFHMDLMYMNDPPGYQLLHCLQNSCDGGESLFTDTFKVAQDMLDHQPHDFDLLTRFHLRYAYKHKENDYDNTWPVFELGSPSKGSALNHVNYSPPFQAPMTERVDSNSLPPKIMALQRFSQDLEKKHNVFELKLKPGQCVIFENRRIVHARRQFNTDSGERWLAGAYVDEDAVLSRFRELSLTHPEQWSKGHIRRPWEALLAANIKRQNSAKLRATDLVPPLGRRLLFSEGLKPRAAVKATTLGLGGPAYENILRTVDSEIYLSHLPKRQAARKGRSAKVSANLKAIKAKWHREEDVREQNASVVPGFVIPAEEAQGPQQVRKAPEVEEQNASSSVAGDAREVQPQRMEDTQKPPSTEESKRE
ncbi:hypothetical protein BJY04DRAFT_144893 [Aspergillus karnatakaensis]|uniref:putative Gamma-butyrobetaine hydroxylase subfamily n=1 Tax=Aspergillus karnatakaensis TaxID=1810916 RepID=UPI003CCE2C10